MNSNLLVIVDNLKIDIKKLENDLLIQSKQDTENKKYIREFKNEIEQVHSKINNCRELRK